MVKLCQAHERPTETLFICLFQPFRIVSNTEASMLTRDSSDVGISEVADNLCDCLRKPRISLGSSCGGAPNTETARQLQPPDQPAHIPITLPRTDSREDYGTARIVRCRFISASSGGIAPSRSDAHAYLDPNNRVMLKGGRG